MFQQETINNLVSKTSVRRKASFAYASYFLQLKDQSLRLGLPMLLCHFQHKTYQWLAVFMAAEDAY